MPAFNFKLKYETQATVAEIFHFTLLFCRGRLENAQTHVHTIVLLI